MKSNKKSFPSVHTVSAICAYVLLIVTLWAFLDTGSKSVVLPALFAVVMLIMNNGLRYGDKASKRVVLISTLLALIVVSYDLVATSKNADIQFVVRQGIMLLALFSALWSLIK